MLEKKEKEIIYVKKRNLIFFLEKPVLIANLKITTVKKNLS